jgi:predicted dehydrogenase
LGMPETIDAKATFFDSGVDSSCKMIFKYKNNVEARLESNLLKQTPTEAIIEGTKGKMTIHKKFHAPSSFSIVKDNKTMRFDFEVKNHGYSYEIEHFSSLFQNGKKESDIMSFKTSMQLITLLDTVRNQIGLSY